MSDADTPNDIQSEEGLFVFVKRRAKAVGEGLTEHAFKLLYTVNADTTPIYVKGPLLAALLYLGCPVDAVPDVIPIIGFTDDLGVAAGALAAAHAYITEDINMRAKATVRRIFD